MKTKVDFHSMLRELDPYYHEYTYREPIVQACVKKWKTLEPEDLPRVLTIEPMEWHVAHSRTTRDQAHILIHHAAKRYLESVSI